MAENNKTSNRVNEVKTTNNDCPSHNEIFTPVFCTCFELFISTTFFNVCATSKTERRNSSDAGNRDDF